MGPMPAQTTIPKGQVMGPMPTHTTIPQGQVMGPMPTHTTIPQGQVMGPMQEGMTPGMRNALMYGGAGLGIAGLGYGAGRMLGSEDDPEYRGR